MGIERRDERGSRHRTDAGKALQALDVPVMLGVLQHQVIGVCDFCVQHPEHLYQRGDLGR